MGFPTLPPLGLGDKKEGDLVLQVHSGFFAFVKTDTRLGEKKKKSSTFISEKKAEVLFSF